MVYSGKRSPACPECRIRKTKCDLITPACGQCTRVGRHCSGPRDSTDVMFVHQTRKLVGRPSQKKQKQKQALVTIDTGSLHSGPQSQQSGPLQQLSTVASPLSCIISPVLEDLGVGWFLHTRRENNSPYAMQDHFFSGYHSQLGVADIEQSIRAVGIAGYAKETLQHGLIRHAEKDYAAAVRVINKALSEPDVALRDGTLFSIMMLATFEINTWPRASGLRNLHNHVSGMLSLASLSAKQGNLTELHRRVMALVVRFYAFQSWYYHRPLPPEFFAVKEISLPAAEHFQTRLMDLIIELIVFEGRVQKGMLQTNLLFLECGRLDNAIDGFCNDIPPSGKWFEYLVPRQFENLVYHGVIHYYPVANAAPQRNILRYAQIHLNLIFIENCRALDMRQTPDETLVIMRKKLSQAEATVKRLAEELCATVPQLADYLHLLPFQAENDSNEAYIDVPRQSTTALIELSPFLTYNPGPFKRTSPSSSTTNEERPPKVEFLYHIYWHLLFLPAIPFLEPHMILWIAGRLRWIHERAEPEALATLHAMKRRIEKSVNMGLYCNSKNGGLEDPQ